MAQLFTWLPLANALTSPMAKYVHNFTADDVAEGMIELFMGLAPPPDTV